MYTTVPEAKLAICEKSPEGPDVASGSVWQKPVCIPNTLNVVARADAFLASMQPQLSFHFLTQSVILLLSI